VSPLRVASRDLPRVAHRSPYNARGEEGAMNFAWRMIGAGSVAGLLFGAAGGACSAAGHGMAAAGVGGSGGGSGTQSTGTQSASMSNAGGGFMIAAGNGTGG